MKENKINNSNHHEEKAYAIDGISIPMVNTFYKWKGALRQNLMSNKTSKMTLLKNDMNTKSKMKGTIMYIASISS